MTPTPSAPPKRGVRIAWPHIFFALIGLALSVYAIHARLQIEAGQATGCSINDVISCDDVIGSKWGKFAGISLGWYGVAFWIVVMLTGISGAGTSVRNAKLQALAVAAVGLVCSLGLAFIAEFVLRKICPICSGTHLTALGNFIYATWAWFKRDVPAVEAREPLVESNARG